MGSMCCKKLESPYSPKLPDFHSLFLTCSDQIQLCRKRFWEEEEPIPKQRKFSVSDISYPLPLGCTVPPPPRPQRKRKKKLMRTTSVLVASPPSYCTTLRRSKSVHEISLSRNGPLQGKTGEPDKRESKTTVNPPDADEIVLDVIRAVGGASLSLDSPTNEPESIRESSDFDEDDDLPDSAAIQTNLHFTQVEIPQYFPSEQADYNHRPIYYGDYSSPILSPLEPIMESAYESLESNSSVSVVAENKRNFLAALLEENNNNNLPSRKSSITESLREFECSLYDMLEQEPTKDELDDMKWRPQIPVYSYH